MSIKIEILTPHTDGCPARGVLCGWDSVGGTIEHEHIFSCQFCPAELAITGHSLSLAIQEALERTA